MEARIHDGDDKVCPFDKDRNSIAVDVQNSTKHFDRRLLRCQSFDMYGNTGKYGSANKEHILTGTGQFPPHNMETMLDSMALYAVHLEGHLRTGRIFFLFLIRQFVCHGSESGER